MKAVDTLLNVWSWGGYHWKIVMLFLTYLFNLYLQTYWANWVNSLNKYFDPDDINRKATFWVGSDCFCCDISRGIPVLQNRNWSANIYWASLSETKYAQHRHTHRHTWTLKQTQMGDFGHTLLFSMWLQKLLLKVFQIQRDGCTKGRIPRRRGTPIIDLFYILHSPSKSSTCQWTTGLPIAARSWISIFLYTTQFTLCKS